MNQDTSLPSDSEDAVIPDIDESVIETPTTKPIHVIPRAGRKQYNRSKAIYERENDAYRYSSPPDFEPKSDNNDIKEATQISFDNPNNLPVNQEQHKEMLQTSKHPPPKFPGPDPSSISPKKKIGRPPKAQKIED
jgi:hypothetical protein